MLHDADEWMWQIRSTSLLDIVSPTQAHSVYTFLCHLKARRSFYTHAHFDLKSSLEIARLLLLVSLQDMYKRTFWETAFLQQCIHFPSFFPLSWFLRDSLLASHWRLIYKFALLHSYTIIVYYSAAYPRVLFSSG